MCAAPKLPAWLLLLKSVAVHHLDALLYTSSSRLDYLLSMLSVSMSAAWASPLLEPFFPGDYPLASIGALYTFGDLAPCRYAPL